ncbi:glycosyltransferase [Gilvimarinus xylanilyticus]|uniref:Glycosyltransferase family 4 protein n=1 Tax=Gilvimarinus xylanilyticus TaxID=2944139 RepID=A0A9X2HXX6_9GAMM|nr:glycosyltransferase family 4 protein [Gilvimarinus xylanilyticus]MCP8900438.1 glycosyltransferase family 4 protein [Gilvimarinus xylanilyticus]
MRALLVGYVWPEPNSSAAGARIAQLLASLNSAGYEVHFACAAALSDHQMDLAAVNVTAHEIALNCESFNEFVARLNPAVVIFDRFVTEEQFGWRVSQACPDAMRVLDTEDLHSLRAARETLLKRELKTDPNAGPVLVDDGALFDSMRQSDMILREVAAIFRCDLTLMISEKEIALLTQYFSVPSSLLYHLPFMVEPCERTLSDYAEREHFVTIGNFRHAPNWDAVLWLKQSIWPQLRKQVPGAELHIYGSYPPKKATQLSNPKEKFFIKGWAADALAVIGAARVLLAPLRFGAGIKGKLMDAMLTQTPSVATSIASESMHGDCPWPGTIADTAEDFAAAAAQLYSDENVWKIASDGTKQLLNARYRYPQLSFLWLQHLNQLRDNLFQHRQRNFLGAMFQYHAARSTEFMSRWIEAKSRVQG